MFQAVGSGGSGTGGYSGDVYDKMEPGYMNLFWTFAYMLGFAVAIVYYLLRKDISESVALFGSYIILVLGGLEDLFYFWFQGLPVASSLPWLNSHIFMGTVTKVLGFSGVTNISLYISVALAFVIVYIMVYYLKRIRG